MKGIYKAGLLAVSAVAGFIAYLYKTDVDVRTKTDAAIRNVQTLVQEISQTRKPQETEVEYEIEQNRQWVEDQWENLQY